MCPNEAARNVCHGQHVETRLPRRARLSRCEIVGDVYGDENRTHHDGEDRTDVSHHLAETEKGDGIQSNERKHLLLCNLERRPTPSEEAIRYGRRPLVAFRILELGLVYDFVVGSQQRKEEEGQDGDAHVGADGDAHLGCTSLR